MNFWACLKCRRWQGNRAWGLRLKITSTTSWLRWLCSHRSKKKRLLKVVLQRGRESRRIEQGHICTCTYLLMHAPCKNISSREGNDWMVCRNKVKGCVWGSPGGGEYTTSVGATSNTTVYRAQQDESILYWCSDRFGFFHSSNHSIIYRSLTVRNCYDSWFSLPPLLLSRLQSISLLCLQYQIFQNFIFFIFKQI